MFGKIWFKEEVIEANYGFGRMNCDKGIYWVVWCDILKGFLSLIPNTNFKGIILIKGWYKVDYVI